MTSRVLVSTRVAASPERAWAVFTGEIGAWWRPSGLFATTPRAPGRLAFADGALVERLEAVGAETRVTVEHRGFDRVPADSAARHGFPDSALLARLGEWWRGLLASYADRV